MRNASDRKDTNMTGKNKSGTVKSFLSSRKNDYAFKTTAGSFVSMAATVLFALYNGYLCIAFLSVWHGSICVFYLLLVAIRGIILCSERKSIKSDAAKREAQRRRTYLISCVMLLMLEFEPLYRIFHLAGVVQRGGCIRCARNTDGFGVAVTLPHLGGAVRA